MRYSFIQGEQFSLRVYFSASLLQNDIKSLKYFTFDNVWIFPPMTIEGNILACKYRGLCKVILTVALT